MQRIFAKTLKNHASKMSSDVGHIKNQDFSEPMVAFPLKQYESLMEYMSQDLKGKKPLNPLKGTLATYRFLVFHPLRSGVKKH